MNGQDDTPRSGYDWPGRRFQSVRVTGTPRRRGVEAFQNWSLRQDRREAGVRLR